MIMESQSKIHLKNDKIVAADIIQFSGNFLIALTKEVYDGKFLITTQIPINMDDIAQITTTRMAEIRELPKFEEYTE